MTQQQNIANDNDNIAMITMTTIKMTIESD